MMMIFLAFCGGFDERRSRPLVLREIRSLCFSPSLVHYGNSSPLCVAAGVIHQGHEIVAEEEHRHKLPNLCDLHALRAWALIKRTSTVRYTHSPALLSAHQPSYTPVRASQDSVGTRYGAETLSQTSNIALKHNETIIKYE